MQEIGRERSHAAPAWDISKEASVCAKPETGSDIDWVIS
jgi:hypothetical protein